MILLDISQILMNRIKKMEKVTYYELRYEILNAINTIERTFQNNYGQIILCCDSKNSWRKEVFPYYKLDNNKEKNNNLDWPEIYQIFDSIMEEINMYFPYIAVKVENTEADDIIAVLTKISKDKKNVIVSDDKDFFQLHSENTIQYLLKQKDFIQISNPKDHLIDLIIKGDDTDKIPNIISDDDTFFNYEKNNQKLTKRKKSDLISYIYSGSIPESHRRNYQRNKGLIDFEEIPEYIQKRIIDKFEEIINQPKRIK